jgi:putative ABC transport system permease protein
MKQLYLFFADATRLALQSIWTQKLRAFLTLLGIIIGVAAVVVVGASINGLNTYVVSTVSRILGVNHFMMSQFAHQENWTQDDWDLAVKRNKKLTIDDYEWLSANCSACAEVGADAQSQVNLKYEDREMFGTQVRGVTANIGEIEEKTIEEGRFIAPHEVEHAADVAVIGGDVRDQFFAGINPVGKILKVRDTPLTIIGVEQKRGPIFGNSIDNLMYLPLTTYGKIFGKQQSLGLHGNAANADQLKAAIEEARNVMRNRRKLKGNEKDNFGVVNTDALKNQVNRFTDSIAAVVVPVTALALVVGGIVVMNIMLVSVTERTFEIGLRKAVGARKGQILLQFLIESSVLTAFGGALGLLLAAVVSWIIRIETPIPMTITIGYVLASVGVSGGVGMIAGIYPAWKASRLDPIVALTKN